MNFLVAEVKKRKCEAKYSGFIYFQLQSSKNIFNLLILLTKQLFEDQFSYLLKFLNLGAVDIIYSSIKMNLNTILIRITSAVTN